MRCLSLTVRRWSCQARRIMRSLFLHRSSLVQAGSHQTNRSGSWSTAAEAQANDLKKQAAEHEARAKELDRQAAIAKGEARTRLRDEANKARESAKQASKSADAL